MSSITVFKTIKDNVIEQLVTGTSQLERFLKNGWSKKEINTKKFSETKKDIAVDKENIKREVKKEPANAVRHGELKAEADSPQEPRLDRGVQSFEVAVRKCEVLQ